MRGVAVCVGVRGECVVRRHCDGSARDVKGGRGRVGACKSLKRLQWCLVSAFRALKSPFCLQYLFGGLFAHRTRVRHCIVAHRPCRTGPRLFGQCHPRAKNRGQDRRERLGFGHSFGASTTRLYETPDAAVHRGGASFDDGRITVHTGGRIARETMHILCPLLALVAHSSPSRATSVATTSILRGDSRGIIAAEPSLSADAGEQRTHQDEVDALDGDVLPRPHRTNSHLFEFSGSCTDADYGASPLYVSPNGNDGSKTNGWGLSTGKPFRTIQHAVDNREGCQTIYVMEGTYPNSYYGQSLDHNNRVVNLDGVSDLKILADPDAGSMPVLEFDGPGGILGGSASDPISNVEIAGLEIRGPNESISYADAMAGRLLKKTHFSGRGIAIRAGHHIYIHGERAMEMRCGYGPSACFFAKDLLPHLSLCDNSFHKSRHEGPPLPRQRHTGEQRRYAS